MAVAGNAAVDEVLKYIMPPIISTLKNIDKDKIRVADI
jgi:hypothetical protein